MPKATPARRGSLWQQVLRELAPSNLARVVFLLVLIAYFGLPILWMILAPSKTRQQLIQQAPFTFGSFENYAHAFDPTWLI